MGEAVAGSSFGNLLDCTVKSWEVCLHLLQAAKDAWVTFIKNCEILNVNEVSRLTLCTGRCAACLMSFTDGTPGLAPRKLAIPCLGVPTFSQLAGASLLFG